MVFSVFYYDKLLFCSRASKAADASYSVGKLVSYVKLRGHIGGENYLRYALAVGYCLCRCAVVVKCHHYLSAVVAVYNSHLVCGRKSSLGWTTETLVGAGFTSIT